MTWEDYWRDRGIANRNAMVMQNLPLVRKIIRNWNLPRRFEREDMEAFGTIGLIEAVEKYDGRGRFSSYAWFPIRREIIDGMKLRRRREPDFVEWAEERPAVEQEFGVLHDAEVLLSALQPIDTAIVRRHFRGWTNREIARWAGRSNRNIGSRYRAAMEFLQEKYARFD